MQIVGIHGKARAGKTSVARWLGDKRNAFQASFADPIKETLIGMFCLSYGLSWEHFENPTLKEQALPGLGRSPRFLAQTLGTEWGRALVNDDLWVMLLEQRLRGQLVWGKYGQMIVIADVRFENEARWVREHGTLLHLTRIGADGNVGVAGHQSESGIAPADGDIRLANDGTLEDLYTALAALFPGPVDGGDE